jgi:small subunit ribosomal protein S6
MTLPQIKNYENVYIVVPDLSDTDYKSIIDKFNQLITSNGGTIVHQEVWGFRKLAYEIMRKQTGFYVLTEFTAPTTFIENFERELTYDERMMRFLTTSLDKFALAYNIKRRNKSKEEPQPANAVSAE